MKKTNRGSRKISGMLLSLLLACVLTLSGVGSAATAQAAARTGSIDLEKAGSITVTLQTEKGSVVTDGTLTLYQVASLELPDWDMVYKYTGAFEDCGVLLDDFEELDLVGAAKTIAVWASENAVTGTDGKIGTDGTVTFESLLPGLYLVVQTEASEGYYAIDPFLITLPMESDNAWEYDVDATPKTEILTEIPETEPEPEPETNPTEPETKHESESEPEAKETLTPVVPATTTTPPASPTLPQTGQLNWPIPVMAILGIALIVAGLAMQRDRRHAA